MRVGRLGQRPQHVQHLGPAVDERYLRYAVRRLAAFANVWWSMANEYDLLWAKTNDDWERLAAVVGG